VLRGGFVLDPGDEVSVSYSDGDYLDIFEQDRVRVRACRVRLRLRLRVRLRLRLRLRLTYLDIFEQEGP
jgi:hypothetical protein